MKRLRQILSASGKVLAVLVVAWVVCFWIHVWRLPDRERSRHYRELPASIDDPTIDYRFVASTIDRAEKRYHLPDCSYVRLLKHGREFATEEEARAAGYEPCQRCLAGRIARNK